jgi:hypothetical protein
VPGQGYLKGSPNELDAPVLILMMEKQTQFLGTCLEISDCLGTTTGAFKMSKENQDQSSSKQQDKNKKAAKGDDKKIKTIEPGDDPNDVAPSGASSPGKSSVSR